MLRPSRPMMRPFSSSDVSSTTDDGGLDGVAARHALHAGGEDAARAPVGVALGLLLDLADQAGAVVAQLVLELAQQDLLGLAGAQAGQPLELAHLVVLRLLQLRRALLEVARAVRRASARARRARRAASRSSPPWPAAAPRAGPARRAGRSSSSSTRRRSLGVWAAPRGGARSALGVAVGAAPAAPPAGRRDLARALRRPAPPPRTRPRRPRPPAGSPSRSPHSHAAPVVAQRCGRPRDPGAASRRLARRCGRARSSGQGRARPLSPLARPRWS